MDNKEAIASPDRQEVTDSPDKQEATDNLNRNGDQIQSISNRFTTPELISLNSQSFHS